MVHTRTLSGSTLVLACAVALGVAGCGGTDKSAGKDTKARPAHLVQVAPAVRQALEHRVERTGTLRALREARIYTQEEGAVLEVAVNAGDEVQAGSVLVKLDDRILRAEHAKAVAARRQAESDVQRLRGMAANKLVAEETRARAETALAVARADEDLLATRLGYMTIRAPFAGQVAQRFVNPGDIAAKNKQVITLVDPTSLITDVTVSEMVLPRLSPGDPAAVRIDALGQATFDGRIYRIYPTVDPATRRGQIEVILEPVPRGASAGQFCRVNLTAGRIEGVLVPLVAVRRDLQGEHVFRMREDGKVERVAVVTGLRSPDSVEILSGVQDGDRVVVAGFLGLADGKAVRTPGGKEAKPGGKEGKPGGKGSGERRPDA